MLSYHGHGNKVVDLFNKMLNEGLVLDEVAFTVILSACSHVGFVEEGWHYFERMRYGYSLHPSLITMLVWLIFLVGQED